MQEYTVANKNIIVTDSAQELSDVVVSFLVQRMKASSLLPTFSVLLSTEMSCDRIYKRLIKSYQKGEISFHKIAAFLSEEFVDPSAAEKTTLKNDNPASRAFAMQQSFFQEVDFKEQNIYSPDTENISKPGAYDALIQNHGGINITLCTLGSSGRLCLNQTGALRDTQTRLVDLPEAVTAEINGQNMARKAVTVGVKTIMSAQEVICVVQGKEKKDAVRKMLKEQMSPSCPASFLREHRSLTLIIDRNAAAGLGQLSNLQD